MIRGFWLRLLYFCYFYQAIFIILLKCQYIKYKYTIKNLLPNNYIKVKTKMSTATA